VLLAFFGVPAALFGIADEALPLSTLEKSGLGSGM
jgi:hypothetical protein